MCVEDPSQVREEQEPILQRQRRREKKKEDADSFSAPFFLVVDPYALAVSSHALRSSHNSKRSSLLALTASILLFLLASSTTFSRSDSNGTGGAALLLSRRSSVVAASRTYTAAFSWSLSGRKRREQDSLRHDTKRLKRRVRGEEAHDASSKRSPASMRTNSAVADDADLRLLRSRIFSKQPPTDDTTPQGPRRERVMPARAAAVSADSHDQTQHNPGSFLLRPGREAKSSPACPQRPAEFRGQARRPQAESHLSKERETRGAQRTRSCAPAQRRETRRVKLAHRRQSRV
jgi:hypothetical protein